MSLLIKNIKQLLQVRQTNITILRGKDMKSLPFIENAYLLIDDDTIVEFGKMDDFEELDAEETIDASGKIVMPAWCDSHTHLVYAGDRTQEFVDRINGLSYEEIAQRGGGILNSAETLRKTSIEELYQQSAQRLTKIIKLGSGAVEIKSGYGLSVEAWRSRNQVRLWSQC